MIWYVAALVASVLGARGLPVQGESGLRVVLLRDAPGWWGCPPGSPGRTASPLPPPAASLPGVPAAGGMRAPGWGTTHRDGDARPGMKMRAPGRRGAARPGACTGRGIGGSTPRGCGVLRLRCVCVGGGCIPSGAAGLSAGRVPGAAARGGLAVALFPAVPPRGGGRRGGEHLPQALRDFFFFLFCRDLPEGSGCRSGSLGGRRCRRGWAVGPAWIFRSGRRGGGTDRTWKFPLGEGDRVRVLAGGTPGWVRGGGGEGRGGQRGWGHSAAFLAAPPPQFLPPAAPRGAGGVCPSLQG